MILVVLFIDDVSSVNIDRHPQGKQRFVTYSEQTAICNILSANSNLLWGCLPSSQPKR